MPLRSGRMGDLSIQSFSRSGQETSRFSDHTAAASSDYCLERLTLNIAIGTSRSKDGEGLTRRREAVFDLERHGREEERPPALACAVRRELFEREQFPDRHHPPRQQDGMQQLVGRRRWRRQLKESFSVTC